MTEVVSNLKTEFPIWYREVSIDADDACRSLRLEAINKLTEGADRDLVEGVVRIAFGIERQDAPQATLDRIHQCFKEKDPTFDPNSAKREVQILAATILVNLFGQSNRMGDLAALSVTTASINETRKLNLPMDIVALAEVALDNRSIEARKRPDISEYQKPMLFKIGEGLDTKADEEVAEEIDASHLSELAKEVKTALRSVASRQTRMMGSLEKFIKVQDEELQVLWWFLGGRSVELDCDFNELSATVMPLVFGKELAEETYILPGLRSIRPLMARAGLTDESKLSIPDMINGADTKWLATLVEDASPSPITQPLHFAISRRLEVDDEKTWIDPWAKIIAVKATEKFAALTLGELFYREQLLRQFP